MKTDIAQDTLDGFRAFLTRRGISYAKMPTYRMLARAAVSVETLEDENRALRQVLSDVHNTLMVHKGIKKEYVFSTLFTRVTGALK